MVIDGRRSNAKWLGFTAFGTTKPVPNRHRAYSGTYSELPFIVLYTLLYHA